MKGIKNLGLYIVLGIVVIVVFMGCSSYNGLVSAEEKVEKTWGNVETNYQRRTDLYSSVIKTIEGSANFEKSLLTEVIEARSKATSVTVDINDQATLDKYNQNQAQLKSSFDRLLLTVERYPDIKTTKAFQDFQTQIEGTENRINVARQDFNGTVEPFNLKVKRFPGNLMAKMFGFEPKAYFKSAPGSEKVPDVNFNIK
jgi:LemA protein